MSYTLITNQITSIPHLDLKPHFSLEKLTIEIKTIKDYTNYLTDLPINHHEAPETWQGRTLVGYDTNSKAEIRNWNYSENRSKWKLFYTDLAKSCPYILQCIQSICSNKTLSRIVRINSYTELPWHSHHIDFHQPPHILTVQIPILISENCLYKVCPNNHFDHNTRRPSPSAKIYQQNYLPGVPYIFNSFHFHSVSNYSHQEKISIMFYADLREQKFRQLLKSAIAEYNGPYL